MNLKLFRSLYASTLVAEPLLDRFWSEAMYDLEGSFQTWVKTRESLEENALSQRKMLETYFSQMFPSSVEEAAAIGDCLPEDLTSLLHDYPLLIKGNEGKLALLLQALPKNDKTQILASFLE